MSSSLEEQLKELMLNNDFAKAEELAQGHLVQDPNNIEVLKLYAVSLRGQNKLDACLTILKKVFDKSDYVPDKELYFLELMTYSKFDEAFTLRSEYMRHPQYRKALKHYLTEQHPVVTQCQRVYVMVSMKVLKNSLEMLQTKLEIADADAQRIKQFIDQLFEKDKYIEQSPFDNHQPSYISFPGLSEKSFIEAEGLIDLDKYQSDLDGIKQDVIDILNNENATPYIEDRGGVPESLEHLKANDNWSSITVLAGDELKVDYAEKLVSCLRENFDLANCVPMAPEVMISILKPDTHIKPHYGLSNIKQTVHIPIILPEGDLALTAGGENRSWSETEPMIFDDSFLHEAWNKSDETRVVLIFDIWHPDLTEAEKTFLTRAFPVINDWQLHTRVLQS